MSGRPATGTPVWPGAWSPSSAACWRSPMPPSPLYEHVLQGHRLRRHAACVAEAGRAAGARRAPSRCASIPTSIPTCRGASSRSSARSRCGWARRSWSISARPTSRSGRSSAPRPTTSRPSPPARGSTSCNASASPSSCCSPASRSTCPWYSSSIPRWTRIGATTTSAPSRSRTPSSRPRRSGRRLCWAALPANGSGKGG